MLKGHPSKLLPISTPTPAPTPSQFPRLQTAEDTFAIVACCREAGVQLMDGTMWTHNPRTAQMEAALGDRARVGEVREVSTLFAFMGETPAGCV